MWGKEEMIKTKTKQQENKNTQPVTVTMPSKQWEQVRVFKPFLESALPSEKLTFLQKTLFKPKKRLRKLQEKKEKLMAAKAAQLKKNAQKNKNTL